MAHFLGRVPLHPRLVLIAVSTIVALAAPAEVRAQNHDHSSHQSSAESQVSHPEPRPGITARGVLASSQVKEKARDEYRAARRIPRVMDGIYCHCDCHERHPELHSLLDCFKSQMAANCGICMGQARLAARLHGEGKSLQQIRDAVDAQYGP